MLFNLPVPRTAPAGLVVYRNSGDLDAIDAYSRRLVEALRDSGTAVEYVEDGLGSIGGDRAGPAWIALQYMAFSYGHWGIAPGLIRDAVRLRRHGVRFVVSVHEAWVPPISWRWKLMGAYQRIQLKSLLRVADGVTVTTEWLGRLVGHGATHVPVGSTITPIDTTHDAARGRLALGDHLVVALFGRGHPSRALRYAEEAIARLAADGRDLTVLNLGAGAPPVQVPAGVELISPGPLDDHDLSLHLWASDLLLLPFIDGVSTRRTTLMAGLAHGLPVAGLRGEHTDAVLRESDGALMLTPLGDVEGFADAVARLAADAERLRAIGRAGRELYAREFDWPVAARRVLSVVQA